MSAFSYDGFNFNDGTAYSLAEMDPYSPAPSRDIWTPFSAAPGGVRGEVPPAFRTMPFTIDIYGSSASDFETKLDALLKAFSLPGRKLRAGFSDNRAIRASVAGDPKVRYGREFGPFGGQISVTFQAEEPYFSALTPLGDVRTPTLAAASAFPGQPAGTRYATTYGLTMGGTAPVSPFWLIVMQAGGPTFEQAYLRNRSGVPTVASLYKAAGFAASTLIGVDGHRRLVYTADLTNTVGLYPMYDASGSVRDASGDSRDLTVAGTPTYLQDGPLGYRHLSAMGSFSASNYLSSASATFGIAGAMSFGGWVYIDSFSGNRFVMSKSSRVAGAPAGWSLYLNSANVGAIVANGTAATNQTSTIKGSGPVAGKWYYIVVTFSPSGGNNRQRIYVGDETSFPRLENEIAVNTTFTGNPSAGANDFSIGRGHNQFDGNVFGLAGSVAEPFVRDVEMTAQQIELSWMFGAAYYNAVILDTPWGILPKLEPAVASNNVIEYSAVDSVGAPTPRIFTLWRSMYL